MTDGPTPVDPELCQRLVVCAKAILGGSISVVDGCRALVALSDSLREREDEPWLTIRGIESETEDYPTQEQRRMLDAGYLASLDREIAQYLEAVCPPLREACEAIVSLYSHADDSHATGKKDGPNLAL